MGGKKPAERMAEQDSRAARCLRVARRDLGLQRLDQESQKIVGATAPFAADRRAERPKGVLTFQRMY